MAGFRKRFYTPRAFLRDAAGIVQNMPGFIAGARTRRVSRTFAEKVMLAVTRVNGCRYCSYFHAGLALRHGVSAGEIERLLQHDVGAFPPEEAVALAFAQHYAETGGHPEAQAVERLRAAYGPDVSQDLLGYIRMITLGNLAGNTVDAFLSRLKGEPAPNSHFLGEFLLFLLFAPFTLPLLPLMHRT